MREAMPPIYWLDKAKEALKISSDAKLAAHMKVSKAAISQLKSEKNQMGAKTAIIIGEILEVPPLLILSSVLSLVKDDNQDFWKDQFSRRSDEWHEKS